LSLLGSVVQSLPDGARHDRATVTGMTDAPTDSPAWFAGLDLAPAADRPELLAEPVRSALAALPDGASVLAAPIDPDLADTAAFCEHYGIPPQASANCVVTVGKREGEQRWAAAVVLATTRADVNGVIRRRLDVRKISFAPMDEATGRTGMAYGGITPIGLPAGWPVLVDGAVAAAGPVVVGSGIRGSKIVIDGAALASLAGAEVLEGLARPA
jgi:prolyl-tRNA editing enzyme YbaK/EbsC (Cys-tRNA(Pro) deacylase)